MQKLSDLQAKQLQNVDYMTQAQALQQQWKGYVDRLTLNAQDRVAMMGLIGGMGNVVGYGIGGNLGGGGGTTGGGGTYGYSTSGYGPGGYSSGPGNTAMA